jgi:hypothetical protein
MAALLGCQRFSAWALRAHLFDACQAGRRALGPDDCDAQFRAAALADLGALYPLVGAWVRVFKDMLRKDRRTKGGAALCVQRLEALPDENATPA